MESSLLDLRNYVENILTDTNTHLTNIAAEVETSHDKIVKVTSQSFHFCNYLYSFWVLMEVSLLKNTNKKRPMKLI